jgi:hypothetical protein
MQWGDAGCSMRFEIVGEISQIETFAVGSAIREIARLRRAYGRGRWRKRKGIASRAIAQWLFGLRYIGTRRPASAARNSRSGTCCEAETMARMQTKQLVVCVKNEGYRVSLEKRKIYVALRDAAVEKQGLLRVVDESGEDYLYPKAFFRAIALPQSIKKAVLAAA